MFGFGRKRSRQRALALMDPFREEADVLEVRGEDQARRRGEKPVPGVGARDYGAEYNDGSFWAKLKELAAKAGRGGVKGGKKIGKGGKKIFYMALVLYYCLKDPDTPAWARGVIIGALGYLIFPADAVPDFLPGGQVDDLAVLAAAVAVVLVHIKPEHRRAAEEKMEEWFGSGVDVPPE